MIAASNESSSCSPSMVAMRGRSLESSKQAPIIGFNLPVSAPVSPGGPDTSSRQQQQSAFAAQDASDKASLQSGPLPVRNSLLSAMLLSRTTSAESSQLTTLSSSESLPTKDGSRDQAFIEDHALLISSGDVCSEPIAIPSTCYLRSSAAIEERAKLHYARTVYRKRIEAAAQAAAQHAA